MEKWGKFGKFKVVFTTQSKNDGLMDGFFFVKQFNDGKPLTIFTNCPFQIFDWNLNTPLELSKSVVITFMLT